MGFELHAQEVLSPLQPDGLLERRPAARLRDLGEAQRHIERYFGAHHLSASDRASSVTLTHRMARLAGLSVNTIAYGADVEVAVDSVERPLFLLMVPLAGRAEIRQGQTRSEVGRGSFVLLDPRETFELSLDRMQKHLSIGIPPAALRRALRGHRPRADRESLRFAQGAQPVTEANAGLFDFIGFLCRELNRPHSALNRFGAAEALEDTFLKLFLAATLGEDEAQTGGAAPRAVRLAQAFMLAHLEEPVSIDDIAGAAGVPARTLGAHFATFRGTSPARWLRRQRLLAARADLSGTGRQTGSVTEVALRYAFGNAGRFSRAYREEFGEYPSQTLKDGA